MDGCIEMEMLADSAFSSLGIGSAIVILCFALQNIAAAAVDGEDFEKLGENKAVH